MNNLATLADRYADLKAEYEGIKRLFDEVQAEIKATGADQLIGARAIVTVTLSEPVRFDSAAAKKLLTPEQVAACTKVGEMVTTIRVKTAKNITVLA